MRVRLAAQQAALALAGQDPVRHRGRTGTLPNGLKYYVRQNAGPRIGCCCGWRSRPDRSTRPTTSRGSRTSSSTWRSTAATHFKPGELVSYFESTGARLGPHVNAYTSFDETVYMLDLPDGQARRSSQKGLTAFADFAGGLTLDPKEIDKERGVVVEEWRGGLGAGSRIRDKQIPILFYQSRYAERLPIGKPEILRTRRRAAARVLRHVVPPRAMAVVAVGDIDPAEARGDGQGRLRRPEGARARRRRSARSTVPLHQETLVSVVTDPEMTQSSVPLVRKRPREADPHGRRLPPDAHRSGSSTRCWTNASTSWRASRTRSSSAPAWAAAG